MAEQREIFGPNLFIIVNSLRPATLLKKVSGTGVFQSPMPIFTLYLPHNLQSRVLVLQKFM